MPGARTAKTSPSRVGELLGGKYRLEKLLGSGAMGQVYRAKVLGVERAVAVKVMREEQSHNATTVTRFLREARAAKKVSHPNVVVVYDIALDDDGAPFIVQELLHGEDLARCLKTSGGTLSPEIALDLLIPIVDAAAAAHASGVVHRDLKPANVYLARQGSEIVPKLLDFGISQLVETEDAARLTATGMALGTPAYMAPEQVMGSKEIDARTDVWSLGVMLHELVAGSLPFAIDVPSALFVAICTTSPTPLDEAAPGVPLDLARVVARCLRRDRRERYANATELANDLRAVRAGKPIAWVEDMPVAPVTAIAKESRARPAIVTVEPAADPSAKTIAHVRASPTPVSPELATQPVRTRAARLEPRLPPAPTPATTDAIDLREFPLGVRGDDAEDVRLSLKSMRPPPGMAAHAHGDDATSMNPAAVRTMVGMLLLSAIAILGAAAISYAVANDPALSEIASSRVPEGTPSLILGGGSLAVCGLVGWSAWNAWRASQTLGALLRAALVAVLLFVALHFLRG